ncbi:MAG: redox-sensing transcriptional repressor Rex [Armatimonadetes bacterium]|nr:redox-sensing transcriptional repressor Rex [Armatimonadota bacterium]
MKRQIPDPTVLRVCTYLRILEQHEEPTISSAAIADAAGVNAAQVRKDLSFFGEFGRPGVGYDVESLASSLKELMGLDEEHRVVIVGAGALGAALVTYPGFSIRGFTIVAIFDNNPAKIGHRLRGYEVMPVDQLAETVRAEGVSIGIIAVPCAAAQEVADALVAANIQAIVNFAPITLRVPPEVRLRNVDLTQQLEVLAYYLTE